MKVNLTDSEGPVLHPDLSRCDSAGDDFGDCDAQVAEWFVANVPGARWCRVCGPQ